MRFSLLFLAAYAVVLRTSSSRAQDVQFGQYDARSAFYVSKSENQNQVHYAVRLDAQCRPLGERPVFAYWRRVKQGKRVDQPLEGLGTSVYGATDEQTVVTRATGGSVTMAVKALKQLRIRIDSEKSEQGCKATAYTSIKGQWARLAYAFLQLRAFGVTVKYVDVVGFSVQDGARLAQRYR